MGFFSAMKAANNYWGHVTGPFCGMGTIGPENMLNNRAQRLKITPALGSGFSDVVFSKNDVASCDVIFATGEWIKFNLVLKNGKYFIVTFLTLDGDPDAGKRKGLKFDATKGLSTGKKVSIGLLNFEYWLSGVIYKKNINNIYARPNLSAEVAVIPQCETSAEQEQKAEPRHSYNVSSQKENSVLYNETDTANELENDGNNFKNSDNEMDNDFGLNLCLLDNNSYSVTGIINSTFETDILIPKNYNGKEITVLAASAFQGNKEIMYVNIEAEIKNVSASAFFNCEKLTRIDLPKTIINIKPYAFSGCKNLKEIFFGGTVQEWKYIEKGSCWDNQTGDYEIYCLNGIFRKNDNSK